MGGPPENGLRIRSVKHLASTLGLLPDSLLALAHDAASYYRSFEREIRGKRRCLVESVGPLKRLQRKILDDILVRLPSFASSFGAVKGRTIKDNASVHAGAQFIAKLDIRAFYPSVHSTKVYSFFISQKCSPDVAHILTALTTRDHSLPLGTSTSPALADQIVRPIDIRIGAMAARGRLKYTRYVDDITLSGSFPLQRFANTVTRVLNQNGFKLKKSKLVFYGPESNPCERIITGVAIVDGRIAAPVDYVKALEDELRHIASQSRRAVVEDNVLPREHYRGKIAYIRWLDPPVGDRLLKLYRRVKWRHLEWMIRRQ
ncbi:MAG: reverse transcriptase family protein [Phycisphaerales bacterium]